MEENKQLELIIKKSAKKTESLMKRILAASGKQNTRIYNKINLEVETTEKGYVVTNTLPAYFVYVDKGRRPGKQPPLQAIISWCRRRNVDKKYAFPIARKIGRVGIPPTNFMDPYRKLTEVLKTEIKNGLLIQMKELFKELKNTTK